MSADEANRGGASPLFVEAGRIAGAGLGALLAIAAYAEGWNAAIIFAKLGLGAYVSPGLQFLAAVCLIALAGAKTGAAAARLASKSRGA